ncbi:MAG TPA: type II toxin-antitoxin system HicB family antitoxin [Terriglobia bacterium]|nr:type II toxin-antitoxin system HicB family antitoxin [Terriglobia bacterium]
MTPLNNVVVIEKGKSNFSAYVPDFPGCVAAGDTLDEVEQLIREAMEMHVAGLREDGVPVPEPTSVTREIEIAGT